MGTVTVEKHFTVDNSLPDSPDMQIVNNTRTNGKNGQ